MFNVRINTKIVYWVYLYIKCKFSAHNDNYCGKFSEIVSYAIKTHILQITYDYTLKKIKTFLCDIKGLRRLQKNILPK